jgi:hypothetical protein
LFSFISFFFSVDVWEWNLAWNDMNGRSWIFKDSLSQSSTAFSFVFQIQWALNLSSIYYKAIGLSSSLKTVNIFKSQSKIDG